MRHRHQWCQGANSCAPHSTPPLRSSTAFLCVHWRTGSHTGRRRIAASQWSGQSIRSSLPDVIERRCVTATTGRRAITGYDSLVGYGAVVGYERVAANEERRRRRSTFGVVHQHQPVGAYRVNDHGHRGSPGRERTSITDIHAGADSRTEGARNIYSTAGADAAVQTRVSVAADRRRSSRSGTVTETPSDALGFTPARQ